MGAWIETRIISCCFFQYSVAPRVGAWIETRRRVLPGVHVPVAPRVGAWIETLISNDENISQMSLPVWERGLKLVILYLFFGFTESLPVWERGLKQPSTSRSSHKDEVAPRVGAWIETTDYYYAD